MNFFLSKQSETFKFSFEKKTQFQGNGNYLVYRAPNRIGDGNRNRVSVSFLPGQWRSIDGRVVSREEIMMTLANVQNVLIRLQYIDAVQREVELIHIEMDSAASTDQGLGSASLVEECRCPAGYSGNFFLLYFREISFNND